MTDGVKGPRPIAHRGCIGAAPENTMPAFRAAADSGCCVEMDVRRTADGQVIVFHDDTLARVARGNPEAPTGRKIRELEWEELKDVRLPYAGHLLKNFPPDGFSSEEWYYYPWAFDRSEKILRRADALRELSAEDRILRLAGDYRTDFERAFARDPKSESIPLFRDFLLWVRRQPDGFFAEVELKESGLCPELFRLIEETDTAQRCILMSGVPEQVEEVQRYAAENGKPDGLRFGANIRFPRPDLLKQTEDYDLFEVGLNADCFDSGDVRRLNGRGVQVFSNLGDTPGWWLALQSNGAAGFKTNCTAQYLKWLASDAPDPLSRSSAPLEK